jgi:hypothetical protein
MGFPCCWLIAPLVHSLKLPHICSFRSFFGVNELIPQQEHISFLHLDTSNRFFASNIQRVL